MSKITVTVPDGDKCDNCNFLVHSFFENAMRQAIFTDSCSIFKCNVENGKKCVACKICAKDGDGNA